MQRQCQGCEEQFTPKRADQKYHSRGCFLAALNRDPERQRVKGRAGGVVRGEQLKADAVPGHSYPKIQGEHEHRVVARRVLGRELADGDVVHHEDLDKTNNDPTNLILFVDQGEHARHHKLGHPGQLSCDCLCVRLGEVMPNAAP